MLTTERAWEVHGTTSLAPTELPHDADHASGTADVIAGQSPAIQNVLTQARRVAETDSTVLVLGETGTGKELIASYVHEHSERRHRE